ncbi:MAG: aminoacyl-tRNA hydrolase [Candidatus Eisenbacteria bacterium]|nr:aminoacyl-tRNA hydrolase [Candidatus Eisenbacteria bacterium]
MIEITRDVAIGEEELQFSASRSSGPGGQHVNTSSTRVTLRFDVRSSPNLTDAQKERILAKLPTRISKEGVLLVSAQQRRSQAANRELAQARLVELLRGALRRERRRKPSRVPEAEKRRRLEEKRRHGRRKRARERPELDDA